jgi:hypothetical protein
LALQFARILLPTFGDLLVEFGNLLLDAGVEEVLLI